MVSRGVRIALLGGSGSSTGELTLAFDWLRRLERPVTPIAILAQRSAPLFAWTGAETHVYPDAGGVEASRAIDVALEASRPDVVVVCDLLLAYLTSPELGRFFRRGPSLLGPLLTRWSARTRVLALDLYDWDRNAAAIDLLGAPAWSVPTAVPPGVGRLCPAPYLAPAASSPGRGRYAMMRAMAPPSSAEREEARASVGVGPGPLVLLTTSPWQHMFALDPRAARVTHGLPVLLLEWLAAARRRLRGLELVHLGPVAIPSEAVPRGLSYHHVPQLEPRRFLPLLGSAELVLSPNCIASSNVRAAALGVPVLSVHARADGASRPPLGRSAAARASRRHLEAVAPGYAHSVWPLGLARLLEAVLEDNPFANTQRHVDVTEPDAAVDAIVELARPGPARAALVQAQADYFARLAALDSPEQALIAALDSGS